MKVIAYYLPQFHTIPENDEWWGKGFTEWTNMKAAKPLFEGHYQPRVPLNGDYYDLSDASVMKRQAEMAKSHGLFGFCFYHYWFGGKLLLEKPVENYFRRKDIDFPFCISWANEHWTNQWVSSQRKVLIEQTYGGKKEWKEHFDYLLPFMKDARYITCDGKPILVIYRPDIIDCRKEMLHYWNQLAREQGLPGICFISQRAESILDNINIDLSMFDYVSSYQPSLALTRIWNSKNTLKDLHKLKRRAAIFLEKHFKIDANSIQLHQKTSGVKKYDYDAVWSQVLNNCDITSNQIPCGFTGWDNTPRRKEQGYIIDGSSPDKFENYMEKLIIKSKKDYPTDLLFLFAWNEWAEGGYLEPDERYKYAYLEALKNALMKTGEMENN